MAVMRYWWNRLLLRLGVRKPEPPYEKLIYDEIIAQDVLQAFKNPKAFFGEQRK
jgi:hypothetical protein